MKKLDDLLSLATAGPYILTRVIPDPRWQTIRGAKGEALVYASHWLDSDPLPELAASLRLLTLAANNFKNVVDTLEIFAIVGGPNLRDDIDYTMTARDIRTARAALAAIEKELS